MNDTIIKFLALYYDANIHLKTPSSVSDNVADIVQQKILEEWFSSSELLLNTLSQSTFGQYIGDFEYELYTMRELITIRTIDKKIIALHLKKKTLYDKTIFDYMAGTFSGIKEIVGIDWNWDITKVNHDGNIKEFEPLAATMLSFLIHQGKIETGKIITRNQQTKLTSTSGKFLTPTLVRLLQFYSHYGEALKTRLDILTPDEVKKREKEEEEKKKRIMKEKEEKEKAKKKKEERKRIKEKEKEKERKKKLEEDKKKLKEGEKKLKKGEKKLNKKRREEKEKREKLTKDKKALLEREKKFEEKKKKEEMEAAEKKKEAAKKAKQKLELEQSQKESRLKEEKRKLKEDFEKKKIQEKKDAAEKVLKEKRDKAEQFRLEMEKLERSHDRILEKERIEKEKERIEKEKERIKKEKERIEKEKDEKEKDKKGWGKIWSFFDSG